MDSSWRKKMKNCEKNLPQEDRSKSTSFLKTIIQCNSLYNVVFEIVRRPSFWRMVGTIFQKWEYSQTDTTNRHSHYSTNQLLRTTKNRCTFYWNIYLFFLTWKWLVPSHILVWEWYCKSSFFLYFPSVCLQCPGAPLSFFSVIDKHWRNRDWLRKKWRNNGWKD